MSRMLVQMCMVKASGEVSDGNEEDVIGNRRKSNPCSKVTKNLAELCSCSSVLVFHRIGE